MLTSPVPELVEEIADRVVVLKDGAILAFDTIDGLRRQSGAGHLGPDLEKLIYPETMCNLDHYFEDYADVAPLPVGAAAGRVAHRSAVLLRHLGNPRPVLRSGWAWRSRARCRCASSRWRRCAWCWRMPGHDVPPGLQRLLSPLAGADAVDVAQALADGPGPSGLGGRAFGRSDRAGLLGFRTRLPILLVVLPTLFLFAYLVPLACVLHRETQAWPFGFAVAFGLGLVIRAMAWTWWRPWPPWPRHGSSARSACGDRSRGSHTGITPSSMRRAQQAWSRNASEAAINSAKGPLGWPFDYLGPKATTWEPSIHMSDGLLISLLIGWWLYVLGSTIPGANGLQLFIAQMVVLGVVSFRLLFYLLGHAPPINLVGRIATMCWIIPGYDKVFIAPFAVLAAFFLIPRELVPAGVPGLIALPIGTTVSVFLALITRPSLANGN